MGLSRAHIVIGEWMNEGGDCVRKASRGGVCIFRLQTVLAAVGIDSTDEI